MGRMAGERLHICVLMSTRLPPEEGIGNHVYNTSRKLIQRGHRVTVITRGDWRGTTHEEMDGIDIFRPRFFPAYPFHVHLHGIFVGRLFRDMEWQFDLLNAHSPLVPVLRTSVPVVTTVHTPMRVDARHVELVNPLAFAMKLHVPVSYWLERSLFARSHLVTTISRSAAEELTEYGLEASEIESVGTGVDVSLFVPPPHGHARPQGKYVLCVARLAYRKGLFDLVRCASIVCGRYSDVRFVVVGTGPLESRLRKAIAAQGMEDKIKLLGHVNHRRRDLIRLYQGAAVYLQPSHYEGMPVTLIEAMACGRPAVATAVSGNIEVISSERDGLLVPSKNPDAMAEAVVRLLADQGLAVELGKAARRTIEEGFAWDAVVDRILRCYDKVLGGRSRG